MKENEQELKKRIGELSFNITRHGATEPPFTGKYNNLFEEGIYVDVVSGEVLFSSKDKFKSSCGWPAFSRPIKESVVKYKRDTGFGMERTEVKSSVSDSHLGHVFSDGPVDSGGLRYCINSAALKFIPKDELKQQGYEEFGELFD